MLVYIALADMASILHIIKSEYTILDIQICSASVTYFQIPELLSMLQRGPFWRIFIFQNIGLLLGCLILLLLNLYEEHIQVWEVCWNIDDYHIIFQDAQAIKFFQSVMWYVESNQRYKTFYYYNRR